MGAKKGKSEKSEKSLNLAISVDRLLKLKLKECEFTGAFLDSFGRPELTGTWLIWGNSGNGKTRFALMLAKYFASLGLKVVYDSLEEGKSTSMRNAFRDVRMQEVKSKIMLLDKEPIKQLMERLSKPKSAHIVIIDSVQYSGLNYAQYKNLRDTFRNKLFILISHSDGRLPEGKIAKSIRFDAFVKVWIEGFVAFPVSRYGGGEPFIVWQQGAAKFGHNVKQEYSNID